MPRRLAPAYGYDAQGRRTNMTTWKNFAVGSGAASTTWHYNERGQMTNKVYADGIGTMYAYTPGGRLKTRKWARGVWTTNMYSPAGDLIAICYSAGPGVLRRRRGQSPRGGT